MSGRDFTGKIGIVVAGSVVGILDITSAFVIAAIRGTGSMRMLQGITSGLIGARSFQGGLATAACGLAIHFLIAFTVVMIFYLASRRINFLTEHAVVSGILYGIAVYLFMYWIVIRLVFPSAHPSLIRDVTAVLVHISLIGLPTALIVRRYSKP
ncbi:MAG TPA: hypothetical protein VKS98_10205 [Chthoniobacterales bacterium]|nr:hypothetical protein [Chthoniobacterales bacterium]